MKNLLTKVLVVAMSIACAGLLLGCGKTTSDVSDEEVEYEREVEEADNSEDEEDTTEEETEDTEEETEATEEEEEKEVKKEEDSKMKQENSIITEYQWQASGDLSLIVCETDGSFKYYQSAEDFSDNYFEGTYEFYMGEAAVDYITIDLSAYGVTREELQDIFDRNEQYDESNFVILVLNNEACIMGGENVVDSPYQTPYFGFYLQDEGVHYLDIANMNTGNYAFYVGK